MLIKKTKKTISIIETVLISIAISMIIITIGMVDNCSGDRNDLNLS